jgi:hypothetical protein
MVGASDSRSRDASSRAGSIPTSGTSRYNLPMDWDGLPGWELVEQGVTDLRHGAESVPALLVAISAPRLRRLGIEVPGPEIPAPEHRLYLALSAAEPDSAHSRYNALLRRLVSGRPNARSRTPSPDADPIRARA